MCQFLYYSNKIKINTFIVTSEKQKILTIKEKGLVCLNCPKCRFGIMEYIGKSSLGLFQESLQENSKSHNINIPIEVYVCSFEDCSHIEIEGKGKVLSKVKDTIRRETLTKEESI